MTCCRLAVCCLALAFPGGLALGGQDDLSANHVSATDSETMADGQLAGEGAQSTPRRLEVGMSLKEALQLLGKGPDSETEIGAACGMLDVLTWDEEGTRLISVDGTVTSIYEGKKQESQ